MRSLAKLALVALVLCVAGSAFAWDIGGYIDNTTGLESAPGAPADATGADRRDLIQRSAVAAWMYHRFGNWELDAQGSYTFTPAIPVLFDVDRLVFGGLFPAQAGGARSFGFQMGRMQFSDATGYVLNHRLDGVRFTIGRESAAFSAGIGTSAILQLPTAEIVMSSLDVGALSPDNPEASVTFYNKLATPRLIASFNYQVRSLFAGQDLTLGAVVQEDLRPQSQLTPEFQDEDVRFVPNATEGQPDVPVPTGGAMDTQYVTLLVSGGIVPGLFHRTFYTLNTGRTLSNREDADALDGTSYQYTPIFAHMAGLELSYFLPSFLNSRITLGGLFSTGDTDAVAYYDGNTNELATAFVPISASAFSDVFTLQPGNSSHVAVSYSVRPLSGIGLDILQTELSSVAYFRTAGEGPVSDGAVNTASTGAYVGTEIDLKVVVQPFSDLRVVLSGGVFLPNASVMTTDNETPDYQLALQGVLRF
jgi:hypothetical protein